MGQKEKMSQSGVTNSSVSLAFETVLECRSRFYHQFYLAPRLRYEACGVRGTRGTYDRVVPGVHLTSIYSTVQWKYKVVKTDLGLK